MSKIYILKGDKIDDALTSIETMANAIEDSLIDEETSENLIKDLAVIYNIIALDSVIDFKEGTVAKFKCVKSKLKERIPFEIRRKERKEA